MLKTDIYELFQNPELARQYTFQPFKVIQLNDYKREDLQRLPASIRLFVATIVPKGGHSLGLDMIEERDAFIIEPLRHIGTELLNAILTYLVQKASDRNEEEIVTMMENNIPERSQEIRTAYDQIIAKGRAEGKAENLVKLVQNTNMTLEQASEMLEASDEVIQLARKQLQK